MKRKLGLGVNLPCRPVEHDCVRRKSYQTLQAIVDDYVQFHAPIARAEITYYRSLQPAEAIKRAARAERPDGKRHDHQRRIRKEALRKVQAALRPGRLPKTAEFHELYQQIAALTRNIKGIGPLFVYDTALRVGASRGVNPKRVYIHAGVRKGAGVLLGGMPAAVPRERFPPPLSTRSASEIEDILCIFAHALERIKKGR